MLALEVRDWLARQQARSGPVALNDQHLPLAQQEVSPGIVPDQRSELQRVTGDFGSSTLRARD